MTAKQFLSRNCSFENNIIVYEQYKRKKSKINQIVKLITELELENREK